jgi:hypothetical protein
MRATVLAELQRAINAHLDEEERLILPLSSAHLSAEEWDAFGERALASIPRRYMPIVLGWVSSEATSQEWAPVRQMLPRLVRSWPRPSGFPPTPSAVVACTRSLSKLPWKC